MRGTENNYQKAVKKLRKLEKYKDEGKVLKSKKNHMKDKLWEEHGKDGKMTKEEWDSIELLIDLM